MAATPSLMDYKLQDALMLVDSPSDVFDMATRVLADSWCHDSGPHRSHQMTPAHCTPFGAPGLEASCFEPGDEDLIQGDVLASVLCRALSTPLLQSSQATPGGSLDTAGASMASPDSGSGSATFSVRSGSLGSVLSYPSSNSSRQQTGAYSSSSTAVPGTGMFGAAPSEALPPVGPWELRSSASVMSAGAAGAAGGGGGDRVEGGRHMLKQSAWQQGPSLPTHHRHKRRAVQATPASMQLEQQQRQLQMRAQLQRQTRFERKLLGHSTSSSSSGTASMLLMPHAELQQYHQKQEQQQQQAELQELHELLQQQEAEVQAREAELQATAQAAGLSELVLRELQQQVKAYAMQSTQLLPQHLQQQTFQQQQAAPQQMERMLSSGTDLNNATTLARLQAALRRGTGVLQHSATTSYSR